MTSVLAWWAEDLSFSLGSDSLGSVSNWRWIWGRNLELIAFEALCEWRCSEGATSITCHNICILMLLLVPVTWCSEIGTWMFADESIALSLWSWFCAWPGSGGCWFSHKALEVSRVKFSITQSAVSYLSLYVGRMVSALILFCIFFINSCTWFLVVLE